MFYFSLFISFFAYALTSIFVEMEVSVAKKNKRVQEAAALATIVIKEGKFQLPKPGDKRKFGVDTS